MRADRCGFTEGERGAASNMTATRDSSANESVVVENAIAPGPATPASMPATFTGQYPVPREEAGSELQRRRERIRTHMTARETLPERLRARGYTTGAFTPNPFTSRYFGFDQGFDHFEDFMDETQRGRIYDTVFRGFLQGDTSRSLVRVLVNLYQREEVFKPWEAFVGDIESFVERTPEPYFLWVFLMDAHNPYLAPREYRSQPRWAEFHANYRFWRESHETPFSDDVHERLVRAYDDAVGYVDAFVARLKSAVGDRTAIVVHGDHGEAFGEHGSYGHGPHLWEENVHVPLLVHGTGQSGRIDRPVSLRRLPDLLARVATDRELRDVASPMVYSRTFDAETELLRGRSWRCLLDGDGRIIERRRTGTFSSVDELNLTPHDTAVFGDCFAAVAEDRRERDRVVTGAKHAAEGDLL
jgi:arylsulfatase